MFFGISIPIRELQADPLGSPCSFERVKLLGPTSKRRAFGLLAGQRDAASPPSLRGRSWRHPARLLPQLSLAAPVHSLLRASKRHLDSSHLGLEELVVSLHLRVHTQKNLDHQLVPRPLPTSIFSPREPKGRCPVRPLRAGRVGNMAPLKLAPLSCPCLCFTQRP